MDRNSDELNLRERPSFVALLAEGVDRNFYVTGITSEQWLVALLAEGVDRNVFPPEVFGGDLASPSSRRAWIEIPQ